jgi:transcriptional regulator with XRE-family HTH domain
MGGDLEVRKAFGAALRELRLKRGLSQEGLALESDLDRTFVSMLERGLRQPSLGTLFALSVVLNVRPSMIVTMTEKSIARRR